MSMWIRWLLLGIGLSAAGELRANEADEAGPHESLVDAEPSLSGSSRGAALPAPRALDRSSLASTLAPDQRNWAVPTYHATALMTTMRLSEAVLWPEPFAETRWPVVRERYREAWTRPPKWDSSQRAFEWDGDPWYINVVGHALFGSELYLRTRNCHIGPIGGLLFTAAASAVWDYGFEASGVRPSALDLWYTPLAGALLGEARYWLWRAAGELGTGPGRTTLRLLMDPFGELERAMGAVC